MDERTFVDRIRKAEICRAPIMGGSGMTNVRRIADAEGDGLPGLIIDDFDGHWLAQGAEENPPPALLSAGFGRSLWWKRLDQKEKESPLYVKGEQPEMPFTVMENSMRLLIDFTAGYSQGVFLDQRENRLRVRNASREGMAVLNCFSYTCAFSLAAALGGAVTTSVDLSGNYLDWGKRNFETNGIDPAGHYFSKGDVFEWLGMFGRKGRRFDGIVLDPPTFSRGRSKRGKGGVFRVEKDYGELVEAAMSVLAPGGWLLCCANTRRMESPVFQRIVEDASGFKGRPLSMPADFRGEQYLKSVWLEG